MEKSPQLSQAFALAPFEQMKAEKINTLSSSLLNFLKTLCILINLHDQI